MHHCIGEMQPCLSSLIKEQLRLILDDWTVTYCKPKGETIIITNSSFSWQSLESISFSFHLRYPLYWIVSFLFLFILIYFLSWSIVDLQCCVNFCCITRWLSYTHIYILFHILFHYGLSQDIEYSSLCYTVGPCCLSIPYVIVCIYQPQTPRPSLSLLAFSLATTVCSLCPWVCFCFVDRFICAIF